MKKILLVVAACHLLMGCMHVGGSASVDVLHSNVHFVVGDNEAPTFGGSVGGYLPSDEHFVTPFGRMFFNVYLGIENDERFVLVSKTEMTKRNWEFDLERPDNRTLSLSSFKEYNWFFTERVFLVESSGDWYSELLVANGKKIPEKWLAFRYSATPYNHVRLLAEYREKAPECLLNVTFDDRSFAVSREISNECRRVVSEFTASAKNALRLEDGGRKELLAAPATMPNSKPNFKKLVGTVKPIMRDVEYIP